MDVMIRAMDLVNFDDGHDIITQGLARYDAQSTLYLTCINISGNEGDYFYILSQGTVQIFVNGNQVGKIEAGGSFGELALLYNTPRAATIRSEGPCELFALDRDTFKFTLAKNMDHKSESIIDALKSVPVLSKLKDDEYHRLADAIELVNFSPGAPVFKIRS